MAVFIPVKDNWIFFRTLCDGAKVLHDNPIKLKINKGHLTSLFGESYGEHVQTEDEIVLIVDKVLNKDKYGLKLRCEKLHRRPYFRFDSNGPAHNNRDDSKSILENQIHTPHFNTFNEQGEEYAYQNDVLKDHNQAKAIAENMEYGIDLFCREINIFLKDGKCPECVDTTVTIGLNITAEEETDNVNFQ